MCFCIAGNTEGGMSGTSWVPGLEMQQDPTSKNVGVFCGGHDSGGWCLSRVWELYQLVYETVWFLALTLLRDNRLPVLRSVLAITGPALVVEVGK